jgi:hypothetical protein
VRFIASAGAGRPMGKLMKRRRLTDFIKPLYSDAKTGKIVVDDPPDLTTPDLDKLAGDERPVEPSVLPVLKTGDILISRKGTQWKVHRVHKPKRNLYDEPMYRLERTVIGNQEWDLTELAQAGLRLEEV